MESDFPHYGGLISYTRLQWKAMSRKVLVSLF